MTDNDDRMTRFEQRLDALGVDVGILKDDVRVLKDDVSVLKGDVGRLRVLYEDHDTKIGAIAEAQAHHGALLEQIRQAVAPLGEIHDFVRRVAHDHEQRLSALEKHTGIQTP
jgi:hypothetical protein